MVRAKVREPSTRLIRTLRAHHSRQKLAHGLKLKAANSNRTLTSLKAALNMAVANRQCVAALAIEWNEVQPLPGDKKRRTLFLDLDQRRNLLAHCGKGSFQSGWLAVAVNSPLD